MGTSPKQNGEIFALIAKGFNKGNVGPMHVVAQTHPFESVGVDRIITPLHETRSLIAGVDVANSTYDHKGKENNSKGLPSYVVSIASSIMIAIILIGLFVLSTHEFVFSATSA
jgi:hypothetical protein